MSKLCFREIEVEDAKKLLDWRTSPRVSEVSLTDVPYDIRRQEQWILKSREREDFYHWIIVYDGIDIGYTSIYDIGNNRMNQSFYIGENNYAYMAIGILLEMYLHIFYNMKISILDVQISGDNKRMQDLVVGYFGYIRNKENDILIQKNQKEMRFLGYILEREAFLKRRKPKIIPTPLPTTRSVFKSKR